MARARGPQKSEAWPLVPGMVAVIGRQAADSPAPTVDLWPDTRVSRRHAEIWERDGGWWIEDRGSTHGTRVNHIEIAGQGPVAMSPWAEIELGETQLILAPPEWHRLRGDALAIDLGLSPALNLAVVHSGLPIISYLAVRNWGTVAQPAGVLELALGTRGVGCQVSIPELGPGESFVLRNALVLPVDDAMLEGQLERSRQSLRVSVDGRALVGELPALWLLAHNDWSCAEEHQLSLAAFVQPNHPLVSELVMEATGDGANRGASEALATIYQELAERWDISYRIEPPHWHSRSQKIRLTHQVLMDPARRTGQGTCIDLALLIAACLEQLGYQPLVAILDMPSWRHALVGFWNVPGASLEPLIFDRERLLSEVTWVDPTGVTRDPASRLSFPEACLAARALLAERQLVFGLDVVAARQEGITPLPFAGEPRLSPTVERAIHSAREIATRHSIQLGAVALTLGLLELPDGLTRAILSLDEADRTRLETLIAQATEVPPGTPPSAGYLNTLVLARARAKEAGSPQVLEAHMLGALLDVQSRSLDSLLRGLNRSRATLQISFRAALRGEVNGGPAYSVFSEFPSGEPP